MALDAQVKAPERSAEGSQNKSGPNVGNLIDLFKGAQSTNDNQNDTTKGVLPPFSLSYDTPAANTNTADGGEAPKPSADAAKPSADAAYNAGRGLDKTGQDVEAWAHAFTELPEGMKSKSPYEIQHQLNKQGNGETYDHWLKTTPAGQKYGKDLNTALVTADTKRFAKAQAAGAFKDDSYAVGDAKDLCSPKQIQDEYDQLNRITGENRNYSDYIQGRYDPADAPVGWDYGKRIQTQN